MSEPWKIDDLTIWRVEEMHMAPRHAQEFFVGLSDEVLAENRDWLRAAGALDDKDGAFLTFQSYVVKTPHHTILLDSCYGNDKNFPDRPAVHQRKDESWLKNLAATGFRPEDFDIVMCTHMHADHVGWNTRLENGRWVPTFPNARYLFSEKELAFWTAESEKTPITHMQDSVLPIVAAKRADLITSSHELSEHVRLLPTPGHTIDHFSVRLGRGRDTAVMVGDAVHSPLQLRYPDLSLPIDYDQKQSAASRKALLARYCDTDTLCCTIHFAPPSAGKIKRWGDGFKCEMVAP